MEFSFSNPLWRWEKRRELWTFVSLSEDASDKIAAATENYTHGFGSVRVEATIGGSRVLESEGRCSDCRAWDDLQVAKVAGSAGT